MTQKKRWRKALGERYAIQLKKKELKQQGFDTFFTPGEFTKLERPI
jgi:hypothetical protein